MNGIMRKDCGVMVWNCGERGEREGEWGFVWKGG